MLKIKFLMMVLIVVTGAGQRMHAQSTFPVNDITGPKDGCYAFIQERQADLNNKQKQQAEKYRQKCGIK